VDTRTSLFCSAIRASYLTQLYKIIFVAFLGGESIKMCANIFYILIAVNRYMLIGREHNPTLEKISKWEMKWVIGVSALCSLTFNIGHTFEYYLNNGGQYSNHFEGTLFFTYYAYETYPALNRWDPLIKIYGGASEAVPQNVSTYLIIYFLVNFLLFFTLNTLVEVVLVVKLHAELKDKRRRMAGMSHGGGATTTQLSRQSASFRKMRKQHIEEGTERRAVAMVVINAIVNFILRLPELFLVFSIAGPLDSFSLAAFFNAFPSLPLFMTDLAYLMYILTFTTNFFVYYLFNQKFKQTFAKWTHVKQKT
jgi:hypothetical protein